MVAGCMVLYLRYHTIHRFHDVVIIFIEKTKRNSVRTFLSIGILRSVSECETGKIFWNQYTIYIRIKQNRVGIVRTIKDLDSLMFLKSKLLPPTTICISIARFLHVHFVASAKNIITHKKRLKLYGTGDFFFWLLLDKQIAV